MPKKQITKIKVCLWNTSEGIIKKITYSLGKRGLWVDVLYILLNNAIFNNISHCIFTATLTIIAMISSI